MRSLLVLACLVTLSVFAAEMPGSKAVHEALRIRSVELGSVWPRFDPASLPVAMYDGSRTFLFNHPEPPDEFSVNEAVAAFAGRYPDLVANSTREIGGVMTATVMPSPNESTLDDRVGLVAHELFHVFQRVHRPDWVANEADHFTYPFADTAVMRSRILEEMALRDALLDKENAACHVGLAVEARHQRYELLDAAHREFERRTELNEGLAQYIQNVFSGKESDELLVNASFAPDALRLRLYSTGAAIAFLLDEHLPGWKQGLMESEWQTLDEALASAGGVVESQCDREGRRQLAASQAERAISDYRERLVRARNEFLRTPGLRVRIKAGNEPLWPQGFDPMNITVLNEGDVLHTRFVKLGNNSGALNLVGGKALTSGAGEHPLFNGVREVVLTGIDEGDLVINETGLVIRGNEITAEFSGKTERQGDEFTLFLP